ncbi:M15 family metallopeptidase [Rhizorhabdus sp.]|uniref:M15 family metallopeptidase n=1 Tax=Rhizorhabdus sp. TaxID=1968843 RepID=UPI0019CEAED0|nr:M15 family metallopeptidase [Rhizorhabdus sp.]MBD3762477.1 M15 family metallopeptidase [Rhizorhabdus sp.]
MSYALGAGSRAKLAGVDPRMVRVVERAIQISSIDFKVICGVRTLAEQKALYAQGRTKPGPKVTWTLNSRHLPDPKTGFGRAVDLLPAPYDWKLEDNKSTPEVDDNFKKLADAMLQAAKELGIPIRWGANWDGDTQIREKGESDNPHFELAA